MPVSTTLQCASSNMTLQDHPKYQYSTLEDVIKMLPVPPGDPKKVNIYGIVVSYDKRKNQITLMDETRSSFSVFVNLFYDPNTGKSSKLKGKNPLKKPIRLPFRTGDIIRIHRLVLNRDFTCRSYKVADLVVFKSYKECEFVPTHLSSNPSFSKYDTERVKKLQNLSVEQLLRADVKLIRSAYNEQNFLVTDTTFQVLAVQSLLKSHIIVCWNGKPFPKYPCHTSVPLNIIFDNLRDVGKRRKECYNNEFVRRLYQEEKLIFITVYGDVHRMTVDKLEPMDTIVIYNMVIKQDNFFYGKFSFLIYDSEQFGRAIRLCSPKSKIATILQDQIEHYYYFDGDFSMTLDISQISITSPNQNNAEET